MIVTVAFVVAFAAAGPDAKGTKAPAPSIAVAPIVAADIDAGAGRAASEVAQGLEAMRPSIGACANEAGKEQTIALTLFLKGDGSVASIDVAGTDKHLTSCMRGTLASAHFSTSATKDQTVKVSIHAVQGAASPVGSVGKDVVRKTVKDHVADVRGCYESAKSSADGNVTMRWTVKADGKVADVNAVDAAPGFEPVVDCLKKKIALWKWTKPAGGDAIVSYPFAFKMKAAKAAASAPAP